jgi:hypothetical protein
MEQHIATKLRAMQQSRTQTDTVLETCKGDSSNFAHSLVLAAATGIDVTGSDEQWVGEFQIQSASSVCATGPLIRLHAASTIATALLPVFIDAIYGGSIDWLRLPLSDLCTLATWA